MTAELYRDEPYLREAAGGVIAHTAEGGIVLDATIFYPQGGGQPGDSGILHWEGGQVPVTTTVRGDSGIIVLVPAEPVPLPPIGTDLRQALDWERRYRHMRVHTALHLLSVVIPFGVTGGSIGSEKGRLDFNMSEPIEDKQAVEDDVMDLIDRDLPVREDWITDDELAANPGLIKTMSVQPPSGQGRVRLIRIGAAAEPVDLQPCGGTHVASTKEIGPIRIGKVEKKGRENRRVNLMLD